MPQHGELSVQLALIRAWDEHLTVRFDVVLSLAEEELGIEISPVWAANILLTEARRRLTEQESVDQIRYQVKPKGVDLIE